MADDMAFDLLHDLAQRRSLPVGQEVRGQQVAVGGEQGLPLLGFLVVLEEDAGEDAEDGSVAVVLDGDGPVEVQRGVGQVHVDVGEAVLALVGVGREGRDHHDGPHGVGQGEIVEPELAPLAGAVDQLPGVVLVPGDPEGHRMLPCVYDVVHGRASFSACSIASQIRFVYIEV